VWRRPVASSDEAGNQVTPGARRLSRVKVNALLTVGLVLLWGLRTPGAMPAFWLLAVVIVWPLADRMTRRAVEHLLRPPGATEVSGLPTLTAVFLERGLRAGLIIGALALLAWGWGIDLESRARDDDDPRGARRSERRRHCPAGNPDPKHVSTSYVERANLTMRMAMRRFTLLTNAFSKKLENHAHMVALYALWYNFVRIHKTLRTSPAMAAGIETRLWSMEDVVRLIETREDLRSGAMLIG
jgi:hypothetical protein